MDGGADSVLDDDDDDDAFDRRVGRWGEGVGVVRVVGMGFRDDSEVTGGSSTRARGGDLVDDGEVRALSGEG